MRGLKNHVVGCRLPVMTVRDCRSANFLDKAKHIKWLTHILDGSTIRVTEVYFSDLNHDWESSLKDTPNLSAIIDILEQMYKKEPGLETHYWVAKYLIDYDVLWISGTKSILIPIQDYILKGEIVMLTPSEFFTNRC